MSYEKNKDATAYPVHADTISRVGLTKRELIAAMAMQGLMAVNNKGEELTSWEIGVAEAAKISVMMADALLIELEK